MQLIGKKMFFKFFGLFKDKKGPSAADQERKNMFNKKYAVFQELLKSNNLALQYMADISEKLSGEFLFDNRYIEQTSRLVFESVQDMVEHMNELSHEKYSLLRDRVISINAGIEAILVRKSDISVSSYTIPFADITKESVAKVGGKNANLGEVKNRVQLPIPEGFAISAFAFQRFMEHNDFQQKIGAKLSGIQLDNLEVLNAASAELQSMIINGEIPSDLEEEFLSAYSTLCERFGREITVSVRSSALQEDSDFSFAGQYATFLNVDAADLLLRYKEVLASLFTSRAIFYFKAKGIQDYDMGMAVGILKMIDARAGGVIYSRDPNNPKDDSILVSAVHGLGKCVVDGTITPQTYTVSRDSGMAITNRNIHEQKTMIYCNLDGEIAEIPLPEGMAAVPCIDDEHIRSLASYAVAIENHYQYPVDIEWAIDGDGEIYILQARPLRILTKEMQKPIPTSVPGYNLLIDRGVIACKGIGSGPVYIANTEDDLRNFPEGAVLVSKITSPFYVTVMNKTAAIVTDIGGATGHMASLAREFQVPCILDTEIATHVLKHGQEITVDAFNCNVYEGRVVELIELAGQRENPFKDTQIFKTLQKVVKWIVPLNLVNPHGDNFKPEFCETFHDITRFCHEKAMNEMFQLTDIPPDEIVETHKLIANIPLVIYIIDLDDGVRPDHPKTLGPEHIESIPLRAFVKGLVAMRWPQAKPVDMKGFLGMMAHTASIPEEELRRTGEKSFTFISRRYMNFLLRLGYHLSMVEAFIGENLNDNYIRFFFKGGGAAVERRLRRVRLITEILKRLGFSVKVVDDVVEAVMKKFKQPMLEVKLEVLGRLTAYTKQLDMVMFNDAITDFYIEEFVKNHFIQEG